MAADVADSVDLAWESESIPDDAVLYMRAHRQYFRGGILQPGVFRDQQSAMSTEWQKYCDTPQEARSRAKEPKDNAIISLIVGDVRGIQGLTVVHTPDPERLNRAHVDVVGAKTDKVRSELLVICDVVLPLEDVNQVGGDS